MSMSDRDFSRLSEFIEAKCGIKMPASKKTMLEARLQRRLCNLGLNSFSRYCDYLFSSQGMESEQGYMIDAVTTNQTGFFREPRHFDYLGQIALPGLIRAQGPATGKRLMVWSAGCSTGEEPYTLAMVLSEFYREHARVSGEPIPMRGRGQLPLARSVSEKNLRSSYSILATDISNGALEKARLGIYSQSQVEPVPMPLRKKYLLRSKDAAKGFVRIVPELRAVVQFRRLNFMDDEFGIREPVDIIFCRNVMIYLDRPAQAKLLNKLCRHLNTGGYLFLGHSETMSGLGAPLLPESPTIYRKPV